jgi:hypothetical protein
MYPLTSYVLQSEENVRIVSAAVRDVAAAERLSVDGGDVAAAVRASAKETAEANVAGRYLTEPAMLAAANLHVMQRALRDLRQAALNRAVAQPAAAEVSNVDAATGRRKETPLADRALELDPEAVRLARDGGLAQVFGTEKRTPRLLLHRAA